MGFQTPMGLLLWKIQINLFIYCLFLKRFLVFSLRAELYFTFEALYKYLYILLFYTYRFIDYLMLHLYICYERDRINVCFRKSAMCTTLYSR